MNIVQLKKEMRAYAVKHGIVEKPRMILVARWGKAARQLAWRVSGHMHPTQQSDARGVLWAMFHPPSPAAALRQRIVAGYLSILGAKEGGTVQHAIAKFCGIPARLPWCAETFWYVCKSLAGYNGPRPLYIESVKSWELFAEEHGLIVKFTNALPGMAVTYVWDGKRGVGNGDHIGTIVKTGIVRHVIQENPLAAEGNTSGPAGDLVAEKTRYWWQINVIFDLAKLQK